MSQDYHQKYYSKDSVLLFEWFLQWQSCRKLVIFACIFCPTLKLADFENQGNVHHSLQESSFPIVKILKNTGGQWQLLKVVKNRDISPWKPVQFAHCFSPFSPWFFPRGKFQMNWMPNKYHSASIATFVVDFSKGNVRR